MNALTTQQFVLLPYDKKIEYYKKVFKTRQYQRAEYSEIEELYMINDIVSNNQSFHPEMLTEMFEGWVLHAKNDYRNGKYQIVFHGTSLDLCDGKSIYHVYPPKNLDAFIFHCQNYGIGLQIKETSHE